MFAFSTYAESETVCIRTVLCLAERVLGNSWTIVLGPGGIEAILGL